MSAPSSWMRPKLGLQKGGAFDATRIKQKAPFMASVLTLVIVQILITYYTMEKLATNTGVQTTLAKSTPALVILFILPFAIILILAFARMPMYAKLALFTLFSALFGVILSVARRFLTPELVRMAILLTAATFAAMFAVGIFLAGFGYDLFWLGMILFFLLIVLIIVGITFLFITPDKKALRLRAAAVVILFSVFVLYDTNQIIMRDYYGDYVTAGLDYYLDFLNLFVGLLELLSNGS